MRVLAACALLPEGKIRLDDLWLITTDPERVQIALIIGRADELPKTTRTPSLAWARLNAQLRRIVLANAPPHILKTLQRLQANDGLKTPEAKAAAT